MKEKIEELEKQYSELQEKFDEKQKEFFNFHNAFSKLSLKLTTLQQIYRLINTSFNKKKVLNQILQIIMKSLNVEAGSILLLDEEKEELYFEVAGGPKGEEVKKFRLKIGEGIVGWCFLQNEAVAISDVIRDARFKKEISEAIGYEVKSILCSPIQIKGRVKGVIELLNKIDDDVFNPDDIDLLNSVCILTGIILENLEIVNKLRKK